VFGQFAKHGINSSSEHLTSIGVVESQFRERRATELTSAYRLGCQALILGDLVVDIPSQSQVHRQVVRKSADHRNIPLDPCIHLHYVEVPEATMVSASGDAQRLISAIEREWGFRGVTIVPALLPNLQRILRSGDWKVTVAVRTQSQIIAIWPGFKRDCFGLAIDIGSTTIAALLCNLASGEVVATSGGMNPQIRFGEDLMSRVSYVQMHTDGAQDLTAAVREGVNKLVAEVARDAEIEPDEIVCAAVVGNPVMHHLFLGIAPTELGGAPFALATDESLHMVARDVDMRINPGAEVYLLPCIAGHVGADTAAVILAEEPHLRDDISLIVDIGTNAEIVIGNKHGLFACSSPTGPAFEGAQISCGMRAAPGAIERVRIDRVTLDVRFRVIGSDLWSNEAGFEDVIDRFGVIGICGSGIVEAIAEMYLAGVISPDGVIDGAMAAGKERLIANNRTWSFVLHDGKTRILVTQNDVRQIQLAKAALYAGIKLLLDHANLHSVDRIRLAGAFGSHIDPVYAMALGLIPDCNLQNVVSAGNAAGTGARIALLNVAARREIENLAKQIIKIETATETRFQEYFVDAMALPHKRDTFPNLFAKVQPPEIKNAGNQDSSRPTRRRRKT